MGQVARTLGLGPIAYDPGPANLTLCHGRMRPGTAHLSARLHELFPVRDIPGTGYNCRPINGDPTKPVSVHGDGRADDLGSPIVDGAFDTAPGYAVADFLIRYCVELQVQAIVFDRRSWRPNRLPGWRAYSGPSHVDHLHFEQNLAGAALSPAEIDAVFVDAGLLPDPNGGAHMRIVFDPDDTRPNPTDPRFVRLLGDNRTMRGVNGALIVRSGAAEKPAREVALPWPVDPAEGIGLRGRVITAVRPGSGAAVGYRFA